MMRVTRSKSANADTKLAPPQTNTTNIPIRSAENRNGPPKEAKRRTPRKNGLRQKQYKQKKRQQLVQDINASEIPSAEKKALRAAIYRPFKPKTKDAKMISELQNLANTQQEEIVELRRRLADNNTNGTAA